MLRLIIIYYVKDGQLNQGLDNGDGNGIAADGQLQADEIDSSNPICPAVGMVKDIYS